MLFVDGYDRCIKQIVTFTFVTYALCLHLLFDHM